MARNTEWPVSYTFQPRSRHQPFPCFIMASDGPDPQNLKSWQDAFQYPIPTVRRVEQELRRDIASSKEKLRALVGYGCSNQKSFTQRLIPIANLGRDIESLLEPPKRSYR
jgi:hypothetical protein